MIKNIVFDMGNVLIYFDRDVYLDRLHVSEEERQLLLNQVFFSMDWIQMDRGSKNEQTAYENICQRLPKHLHAAAHELIFDWDRAILPVEGMEEIVRELKSNGYHIFLISNASVRQPEYWHKVPGYDCFEDTLVSANCGLVKPQPEIFRCAYEKFGIKPEESIFIDDVPINVEASYITGMDAIVFHGDLCELRRCLADRGVNISDI